MKHAIVSILIVTILALVPVVFIGFNNAQAPEPAQAAEQVINCTDEVVGQKVRIRCTSAGGVVLNTVVDLPVVEIEVPGETVTVKVPLPGQTQTIRVPQPGPTITIPGPTKTVEIEQPTQTVTITNGPEPVPNPTATVTQTATVTSDPRQVNTTPGTIEPTPEDDTVVRIPETNLDVPEAVGIGTLAVLIMTGLILLGMYAGYYMGYKDSDKAEAKFLKSLLGK